MFGKSTDEWKDLDRETQKEMVGALRCVRYMQIINNYVPPPAKR